MAGEIGGIVTGLAQLPELLVLHGASCDTLATPTCRWSTPAIGAEGQPAAGASQGCPRDGRHTGQLASSKRGGEVEGGPARSAPRLPHP